MPQTHRQNRCEKQLSPLPEQLASLQEATPRRWQNREGARAEARSQQTDKVGPISRIVVIIVVVFVDVVDAIAIAAICACTTFCLKLDVDVQQHAQLENTQSAWLSYDKQLAPLSK